MKEITIKYPLPLFRRLYKTYCMFKQSQNSMSCEFYVRMEYNCAL